MKLASWVVWVLVLILALILPIEVKVGEDGTVDFIGWVIVTIAFALFVAKIAASEWDRRIDLQREIAGFLIGAAMLTLIVFISLELTVVERYIHALSTFTTEVADTALIAATVMSVPAGVWLLFLLRQPRTK